jgi:Fe2+ or Zn2+ uptake regulation protein
MARPSHIRTAIAELVESSSRHGWTIEEVAADLHARGVEADFSSVFRNLTRLSDDGVLARVELGDGKARFEAVHEHHEHISCEECGTVAAVPGCLVQALTPAVEERTGFSVTGHRLVFSGRCAACAGA